MLGLMSASASSTQALTIVTGASRGVGRALAVALLARGERVLTLQRRPDSTLAASPGPLEQWACDLAEPEAVAQRLQAWLAGANPASVRTVTLINNAALLPTPAPLPLSDAHELAQALRVGLEAPMLLSAAFLLATAAWPVPRRLMHISSGLGRRAMAGSGVYCAAKAGLDHLSRVIALEEAGKPNGARSVAIAPGVIDTDMQLQLRSADPQHFAAQAQFAALKTQGQLDTPEGCAAKLLAYLERPDFGVNPVADVRDAG
jgi:benzil reductase ((S)-benzoin forming)